MSKEDIKSFLIAIILACGSVAALMRFMQPLDISAHVMMQLVPIKEEMIELRKYINTLKVAQEDKFILQEHKLDNHRHERALNDKVVYP